MQVNEVPELLPAPALPARALVIVAHPDDAEFGCGGTLAGWTARGCMVTLLLLTSGDKGSHDPAVNPFELAARREAEQLQAARLLGVADVRFLRLPDGEVEPTQALRARLCLAIRQVRPEVIITHDPWRLYQLHPDHRAAGLVASDAAIAARDHLFFPEQLAGGLRHHRTSAIWYFTTDHPNTWIDISATVGQKLAALRAHASQVAHLADLEERVRQRARQMGESGGLEYAEEFHRIELS
jgi:LmbE family N-acetylglucosaminyl deacetylase